jgi:protein-disulfide isomerase
MPDEENFECSKCGRSFDSQRGLSIHQTQSHSDEQETTDTSESANADSQNSSSDSISLSVRHALLLIFTLGLAIGFSAGIVTSTFSGQKLTGDETDNSQISGASTMAAIKDIADSVGADSEQIASCVDSSNTEEIDQDKSKINGIAGSMGTPTFFIGNSKIGYTEVTGSQPYSRMKSTIDQKIQEANQGDANVSKEEYTLDSISFEGEPVMGEKSAPINIIEYSDYGCPWCAEWHGTDAIPQRPIDEEESFNKVKSNYVDTGKVQFVLKDYPVPQLHPKAETAHKAANCVLENSPDNFWEFSQKLYEERDKWQS